MTDISELYDIIRTSTRNVNSLLLEQHKSSFMEDSLERISDLHKHWALSLKTQAKLMEVEIRHLYRY
jgi:DNA-binding transcriptional regulator GbsR (MarR family)